MLRHAFDPDKPHPYARYGRMSSERQNPRSPDQQFDNIQETLCRQGRSWVPVRDYRDDGISGRYMKKRPGLQQMLHDIRSGRIKVDLILVDTLERLGRNDEVTALRHELFNKYGILVLTADSGFADPNTVPGRALGFVEAIRSTEEGRVKAHNVLRGKRDLILQKKAWPGGPIPLGFQLQSVMKNGANGSTEVDYKILVRSAASDWFIERLFLLARQTGWGAIRLAKHFKTDFSLPEPFRTIKSSTIDYILDNSIYKGELLWNEHATGVINDTRVLQENPEAEWLRVPDYCEPIVSQEVWDVVQAPRQKRRDQVRERRRRKENDDGKQIAPPTPGLPLKYLLGGLVRCGRCKAAMRPSPTKVTYPSGKVWRRVYHVCPSYLDRNCPNGHYFPEDALRKMTITRLRGRIFPTEGQEGSIPDWFPELVEAIRQAVLHPTEQKPDERTALEGDLQLFQERLAGWSLSLANPRLDPLLRADIEAQYRPAKVRLAQLQALLTEPDNQEKQLEIMLAPEEMLRRLERLAEILAGENVPLSNSELSRYIDRIDCFADGRAVLRTTPLGAFNGAVELLRRPTVINADLQPEDNGCPSPFQVTPRRRARLRVDEPTGMEQQPCGDGLDITDPHRFAGLDDRWIWEDELVIPRLLSWADAHAPEVAQLRQTGMTMEALAVHFGKTVPTVRNALRKARDAGLMKEELPTKMPRRRWEEDHAAEVVQLKAQGKTVKELAAHFGKSEPTIRKALRFAAGRQEKLPDEGASPVDPG